MQFGEKMVYLLYISPSSSTIKVIWGQNLDARTEAETMEEHWLLAYSPWFSQLAFYISQDTSPEWAVPFRINH